MASEISNFKERGTGIVKEYGGGWCPFYWLEVLYRIDAKR